MATGRGHMRVRINQAWQDSLAWERQRLRAGPRERPDVARGADSDEPAILDRHGLRSWTRIVHRYDVGVYNHEIEEAMTCCQRRRIGIRGSAAQKTRYEWCDQR